MPRREISREERRRYVGYGFVAAMVLAPFIGLLYGAPFGLGVLAIALLMTAWLCWNTAAAVEAEGARRLRVLAALNLALAIVTVVAVVVMVR